MGRHTRQAKNCSESPQRSKDDSLKPIVTKSELARTSGTMGRDKKSREPEAARRRATENGNHILQAFVDQSPPCFNRLLRYIAL